MSTRALQSILASVFLVLGGWCVIAPGSVVALAFRPAFRSSAPIVPSLVAAFGSQALISGLFAGFARFTRRTFLVYGVGLIPFFVFDYYFYAVRPVLTAVGLLDLAGNLAMAAVCWLGWKSAAAEA